MLALSVRAFVIMETFVSISSGFVSERGANIAPYFVEKLYDIIIIEGQDAPLDASAEGFPEPKVTWEKEGKPLTPNKEYK